MNGDFSRVEVDANGNVQKVVETFPSGTNSDPVLPLIADRPPHGETRTAQKVRTHLLDNQSENSKLEYGETADFRWQELRTPLE